MNLNNWISAAKAHWREFLPQTYKKLQFKGLLAQALRDAADKTHQEMTELEASGLTTHEAWEMVREKYLFPPPETAEPDLSRPDLKLMQEATALQNRLLSESESE